MIAKQRGSYDRFAKANWLAQKWNVLGGGEFSGELEACGFDVLKALIG